MDASGTSTASGKEKDASAVQVAVRIRPQGNRERLEGSKVCTSVVPNEPQVTIGDRSFTYDYVFDQPTPQPTVYETCIEKLVEGLFEGFNATVLAYGQTGSGKTHTMGTAFDTGPVIEEDVGVIPRAINHVFKRIMEAKRDAQERGVLEPTFDVSVQFIELYNEEIIDLLADDRAASLNVRIHEDSRGEIYLQNVAAKMVQDMHSTLEILRNGALNRTVASTNMNEQSSRSHAIFTLHVKQQRVGPPTEYSIPTETDLELLSAKFHFVDLAGSERLKRTGATGDRAKEGISINCGLLALGNVISALGGANGKVSHVPYRDSKLTRLLQDSLGGNSRTLMIACVSPSDSDFVETLNTMKYANRAKNIKNKVVANQDKSSKLIGELRSKIASLESELLEFKQGRRTVGADGAESFNDQYCENVMLTTEVNQLRFRVKALQETNEILRNRNVELLSSHDAALLGGGTQSNGDATEGKEGENANGEQLDPIQATVRRYLEDAERLRSSLYEAQATSDQLRKEAARWKNQALAGGVAVASPFTADSSYNSGSRMLIEEAKADIEKLRKAVNNSDATSDYGSHPVQGDGEEEDGTSNDADELEDEEDEIDDDEEMPFEENKECVALRDNLADLQTEIGIKERLISELERSERRLAEVRITYEKKLTELSFRIKQTETERDRILAESADKKTDKASQEAAKRIREEYERKLADMRNEFRKLQMVEKEHKRMQARQERERQELMKYQMELRQLKTVKVDLMKKIKDEMKRAQQQQQTNAKKVALLDKESRKKDNQIKQLESKDRQREQFMKRTNEEINRLRKAQKDQLKMAKAAATPNRTPFRPLNNTRVAAGRTPLSRAAAPPEMTFSPRHAKIKWNLMEKRLARLVIQKQTVGQMEEELARQLKERHRLMDEVTQLEKRFVSVNDEAERNEIAEQLDGCQQKMKYVQDQITETQTAIVDMDTNKEQDADDDEVQMSNVESLIDHCGNLVEAKYLLQHLFNHCVEQAVAAAKAESTNKESEARIQQLEQQSYINEQLLSTVIQDKSLANDIEGVLENGSRKKFSRSPSISSLRAGSPSTEGSDPLPYKARRHTATADELLYPMEPPESAREEKKEEGQEEEQIGSKKDRKRIVAAAAYVPMPSTSTATHPPTVSAATAATVASNGSAFSRHSRFRNTIGGMPPAPRVVAATNGNHLANGKANGLRGGVTRMMSSIRLPTLSEAGPSTTPESPPLVPQRIRAAADPTRSSKSVFARLMGSVEASPATLINRKQGRIVAVKNGATYRVVSRTHTLEGHSKGVLSVAATEDHLLSGSKDRTAKLWDLGTGCELRTLGVHPNNVHAVRFVPNSDLALSVSMYQVRVWDIRTHECIRTLQSSGQVNEGDSGSAGSRQNTVPFLETVVNAAEVDPAGRLLFTSFAGDVRIWNLERWASFGRMVGAAHSPRSEVSCLAVSQGEDGRPSIFTGSRDHYVKMYETTPGGEGVYEPKVEFSPPHYDNVTCMLPHDGHLYTASKDMNIMKFSLTDHKRDHLELKAHNSYVQGMCLVGSERPYLASVCKEGTVKFWDVTSTRRMKLVEEIPKAHSDAINSVCANSYMMFTASSDQTIGFWKLN